MIYIIYSHSREDGTVVHYLDNDFNKAKDKFISMAPSWTQIDGGDNGLNLVAMKLDGMPTLNLLNDLIKQNPDTYAWDKSTQKFLDSLFELPDETYIDSFMADDIIGWLDTEKGIDGFDALDLPDEEWDEYVKEYVNTIL